ncbi:MAG: hypothetical protein CL927_12275 [Deltaproteobacteria bacterium]|nr:hypothetical protein [Deltaproteobacteria bacterium]HCH64764.1 hypothetical protein [Deltaproteobacteria bacterium]
MGARTPRSGGNSLEGPVARTRKKKKPSRMEAMLERYGVAAFVAWFSIFFSSIAMFYVLIELGTDLDALVASVVGVWGGDPSGWTDASAGAGQLALAYLATQVIKPIRIALFVAFTPIVAKVMGTTKPSAEPSDSASSAEADGSEASPDVQTPVEAAETESSASSAT